MYNFTLRDSYRITLWYMIRVQFNTNEESTRVNYDSSEARYTTPKALTHDVPVLFGHLWPTIHLLSIVLPLWGGRGEHSFVARPSHLTIIWGAGGEGGSGVAAVASLVPNQTDGTLEVMI